MACESLLQFFFINSPTCSHYALMTLHSPTVIRPHNRSLMFQPIVATAATTWTSATACASATSSARTGVSRTTRPDQAPATAGRSRGSLCGAPWQKRAATEDCARRRTPASSARTAQCTLSTVRVLSGIRYCENRIAHCEYGMNSQSYTVL